MAIFIASTNLSADAEKIKGKDDKKSEPLYVTFIWNQHQPMYKDPYTGTYNLPWVRLHGVKSYYPMVAYLDDYENIKGVFNLTPSLLEQILDYRNGMRDSYFLISEKSPEKLTKEDKEFILKNFFVYPKMARIGKQPAFKRLRQLKGKSKKGMEELTDNDWRDIQLLHNFAWINPVLRDGDKKLIAITEKPGNYTEKEKKYVLDYHIKIMNKIISAHKNMQKKHKAEIITTPYYHPILPLLIDNYVARRCRPGMKLPKTHFQHPEDALYHVKKALKQYKELYGRNTTGMWPAEQAVSQEIVPILSGEKIKWIVTDESILSKSLNKKLREDSQEVEKKKQQDEIYVTGNASDNLTYPDLLYRPWQVNTPKGGLVVFFRDQFLSDKVGFAYSNDGGEKGAKDLIARLDGIKASLKGKKGPFIVTIALDGENCWENYPDDSRTFFKTLYGQLDKRQDIVLTTPRDFLEILKKKKEHIPSLKTLATGSWNGGNLDRWIGSPSKNKAWDYLYKVREDLVKNLGKAKNDKKRDAAWESLYTAEGSDYAWWFDSMGYYSAKHFDELYRLHLRNVYLNLGIKSPGYLNKMIIKKKKGGRMKVTD